VPAIDFETTLKRPGDTHVPSRCHESLQFDLFYRHAL